MNPTIWHAKRKSVSKFQASVISCWGNCHENFIYTLRTDARTGSRNQIHTKMNPTIWHVPRKSVLKFQTSVMGSSWENCDKSLLWMDRQTDGQTVWGYETQMPPYVANSRGGHHCPGVKIYGSNIKVLSQGTCLWTHLQFQRYGEWWSFGKWIKLQGQGHKVKKSWYH
jgi:hypothetical protein